MKYIDKYDEQEKCAPEDEAKREKMKNNGKKPRQKIKIEESEINPVSRARAYGVTKKEGFLARFNEAFGHFLYVAMMFWAYLVLGIYIFFMIVMLNTIGIMISYITVICFIWCKPLKIYRRRWKFYFKLKRRCKKNKYRLDVKRGFVRSLRYRDEGYDFSVDTGVDVYVVRLLTVKKKNSRLMFNSAHSAQIIHPRPVGGQHIRVANKGTTIIRTYEARGFGIRTVKGIEIGFDESFPVMSHKRLHKILLIQPVPIDVYKKAPEGGTCPTGTGEDMGAYTLYAAHDFLYNLLERKPDLRECERVGH